MAEQTNTKPVEKLINPFIHRSTVGKPFVMTSPNVCRMVGSEYDKEVGAVIPVFEFVNLEEEIQACKGMCGMELMRTLLAQGKAKPEDFYDDGRSGADLTQVPQTVHQAKAFANAGQAQISELCKQLGIEEDQALTAAQLEKVLTAYIGQAVSAQTQAAPTSTESANE